MRRVTWGLILLISLLCPPLVGGEPTPNNYQALQPGHAGYMARIGGTIAIPSPVFQATFTSSLTPDVGTDTKTFTRASDRYFWNGTAVDKVSSGNPAVGAESVLVDTTEKGVVIDQAIKNLLLQSEDFATTWTANGTASVTTNQSNSPEATPVLTADQIDGSAAADGVQQDSGITANSSASMIFRVFLESDSGSRTVNIILKDSTGTAAEAQTACTVTTTPSYCWVFKRFTDGSGTVVAEIEVNDTTGYKIYAWGAMLTQAGTNGPPYSTPDFKYVKTTTAVVTSAADILYYNGSEASTAYTKFSVGAWIYSGEIQTTIWDRRSYLHYASNASGPGLWVSSNTSNWDWRVTFQHPTEIDTTVDIRNSDGQWVELLGTVNYDDEVYVLYLDGAEIYSDTTARSWPGTGDIRLFILNKYAGAEQWGGPISDIRIYNVELTAAQVLQNFNANTGDYAR